MTHPGKFVFIADYSLINNSEMIDVKRVRLVIVNLKRYTFEAVSLKYLLQSKHEAILTFDPRAKITIYS